MRRMSPNRYWRFLLAWFTTLLLVETAALSQVTAIAQIRLGDVARQLSEQDVASLERLLPANGKPWLLIAEGLGAMSGPFHSVEAYLPPETTTRELRRGVVIPLQRRIAPTPEAWSLVNAAPSARQTTGRYAQVAVEGRNFDQIQSDQDINRPFWVDGRLDDSELVSIVAFIRNQPLQTLFAFPPVTPLRAGPIHTIAREAADFVTVWTRLGTQESQVVTLRKQGQSWVITQVSVRSA